MPLFKSTVLLAAIIKSWLPLKAVIVFDVILISSVSIVANVTSLVIETLPVVAVPSLINVLVTLTNSLVVTSPVPAARNSKSLLLTVVEIKLSSITIFSN